MKKHYIGAVYDLTQKNMQNLIEQLDIAKEENASLREASEFYADESKLKKIVIIEVGESIRYDAVLIKVVKERKRRKAAEDCFDGPRYEYIDIELAYYEVPADE